MNCHLVKITTKCPSSQLTLIIDFYTEDETVASGVIYQHSVPTVHGGAFDTRVVLPLYPENQSEIVQKNIKVILIDKWVLSFSQNECKYLFPEFY